MKRKKLFKMLAGWLDKDEPKPQDQRKELEHLLEKLKKKKARLEKKLKREDNKRKHKQLKMKLDIIKVQHAKGVEVLHSLKVS